MENENIIIIKDLKKRLGGKEVLKGVNLEIKRGKTIVIVGRSGCGKSVLLKHIIGLMKPDSGEIFVDGVEITKLSDAELKKVQRKFGMVFQSSALFDSLTVEENIGFLLIREKSLPPEEIKKIVDEKLEWVELSGMGKYKPAELSGGMKKRAGIARALATSPEIIMYDEPTTGLDPIMADAINNLIISLKQKTGITSIVVTHDMVSAYKVGDMLAMLYDGKIIAKGTPEEFKNTTNPFVKQFIFGEAEGPITEGRPYYEE